MALGGLYPLDEPPDINLEELCKCHPKQKVTVVIWIECNIFYTY